MRDALLVRSLEGIRDLASDVQRFLESQARSRGPCRLGQFLCQRLALDELQHEPSNTLALFDAVDDGDVRMVQGGHDSRFTLEAGHPARFSCKSGGQHLDRDVATELGVVSPVDLTHPPATKERPEFECSDPPTLKRGDLTRNVGIDSDSCRTAADQLHEVIRPQRLVQQ